MADDVSDNNRCVYIDALCLLKSLVLGGYGTIISDYGPVWKFVTYC